MAVVVTDDVPPDALAVLLSRRVARVGERVVLSGVHATDDQPRVGDRVREQLDPCRRRRSAVSSARHRRSTRRTRPDARRARGSTSRARRWRPRAARPDRSASSRGAVGIGGGSDDQPELRLAAASFEGEDAAAGDSTRRRDRRGQELDEAGVHRGPGRAGPRGRDEFARSERRPMPGSRARRHLRATGRGRRPRAREGGRRCRREERRAGSAGVELGQVSLGRSWASCRGSPCSAACAPCASWSSST